MTFLSKGSGDRKRKVEDAWMVCAAVSYVKIEVEWNIQLFMRTRSLERGAKAALHDCNHRETAGKTAGKD